MAATTTAIHEAGHAVAHIRLGIEYGHAHIVPDGKGLLGAACGAGVQNVWNKGEAENMVLAFCAGYAALVAAGYPGDEAIDGAGDDFKQAQELLVFWLLPGDIEEWKSRAVKLMSNRENIAAVALVAKYLMQHGRLEAEDLDVLVEVADGNITQAELQHYLKARPLQ